MTVIALAKPELRESHDGSAMHGIDHEQLEFVLMPRERTAAQTICDLLLGVGLRQLMVRPLAVPAGAATTEDAASVMFWTRGRVPPLAVLNLCERVWWGPTLRTRQGQSVYVQWPYEYRGQLARVLPKGGRALTLVSQSPPEVLTIELPDGQPEFEDLARVASFRFDERTAIARIATTTLQPPLEVKLRLVANSRPYSMPERLAQIEREIAAKERVRDRLQRQLEDHEQSSQLSYDPLFVYYARRDTLPIEIKNMLVEWCDEPALRQVRYLRLDAAEFTGLTAHAGYDAHLVTTATTLSEPQRRGENLWLRDYAPSGSDPGGRCFRLLPEWNQPHFPAKLHLFAPDDDRRLELYPPLRPGAETAQRLAAALVPDQATGIENKCIILLPTTRDQILARSIDLSEFQPLVKAISWHCALNVQPIFPNTVADAGILVSDRLREFEAAAETALNQAIDRQLVPFVARMNNELDSLSQQLTNRESQLQKLKHQAAVAAKALAEFERELALLDSDLAKCLRRLPIDLADARRWLDRASAAIASAGERQRKFRDQR